MYREVLSFKGTIAVQNYLLLLVMCVIAFFLIHLIEVPMESM